MKKWNKRIFKQKYYYYYDLKTEFKTKYYRKKPDNYFLWYYYTIEGNKLKEYDIRGISNWVNLTVFCDNGYLIDKRGRKIDSCLVFWDLMEKDKSYWFRYMINYYIDHRWNETIRKREEEKRKKIQKFHEDMVMKRIKNKGYFSFAFDYGLIRLYNCIRIKQDKRIYGKSFGEFKEEILKKNKKY